MKERSIVHFEQGIKSRQTLNNYRDHLKHFRNFAKFDTFDSLITKPVDELQGMVEDYNERGLKFCEEMGIKKKEVDSIIEIREKLQIEFPERYAGKYRRV